MFSFINSRFVVAAVRRQLLVQWGVAVVDRCALSGPTASESGQHAASIMAALERLIPHEASIAALLRVVWEVGLKPLLLPRDKLASQLEG